jgi:exodeoxyribonuclease VII small subunit
VGGAGRGVYRFDNAVTGRVWYKNMKKEGDTMATDQHPSTDQSFEESLKELEGLVKRFEEGQLTLDQAVEAFTRGTVLKKQCEMKLQQAKSKIELVTAEQSGSNAEAPDWK